MIELRDLAQDITNNLLTGFPSPKLEAAIDALSDAPTALIAVTPIFTTSYSGLFKSFIDVLDPQALTGPAGADRRDRRHRAPLARARLRDAAAVHLPARRAGADRRVRGIQRLGAAAMPTAALAERIDRARGGAGRPRWRDSDRSQRVRDPFALPEGFSPVGGFGAQ